MLVYSEGNNIINLTPHGHAHVYEAYGKIVVYTSGIHNFHIQRDPLGENAKAVLDAVGIDTANGVARMLAEHKDEVVDVKELIGLHNFECDGLISADTAITLAPADCVGLSIVTKDRYALIHAGRRGLGLSIVEKGLKKFLSENEIQDPGEISFIIPPCISAKYYLMDHPEFMQGTWWGEHPEFAQEVDGKYQVDISGATVAQITAAMKNIGEPNIIASKRCTYIDADLASYSLQRELAGDSLVRNLVAVGKMKQPGQ